MAQGRAVASKGQTATQIAALGLIWGFTFLFIKLSVEGLSPLWLVAVRTAAGFAVLLVAVRVMGTSWPRGRAMWAHIAFLAVPGNVIPWAMVAWAQRGVTSAMTAVLYSLIPLMSLLISASVGTEQLTVRKLLGLVLASIGTGLAVGFDLAAPGTASGVLAILGACALLAGGAVYAKRFVTGHVAALPMVTVQLGIACLVATPVALASDGLPNWDGITPSVAFAALTLGVLGTGVAFLIYYALIDRIGATNATMITYITPVIGLIAGGVILDEPIPLSLLGGGAAILAGVWLAQATGVRVLSRGAR